MTTRSGGAGAARSAQEEDEENGDGCPSTGRAWPIGALSLAGVTVGGAGAAGCATATGIAGGRRSMRRPHRAGSAGGCSAGGVAIRTVDDVEDRGISPGPDGAGEEPWGGGRSRWGAGPASVAATPTGSPTARGGVAGRRSSPGRARPAPSSGSPKTRPTRHRRASPRRRCRADQPRAAGSAAIRASLAPRRRGRGGGRGRRRARRRRWPRRRPRPGFGRCGVRPGHPRTVDGHQEHPQHHQADEAGPTPPSDRATAWHVPSRPAHDAVRSFLGSHPRIVRGGPAGKFLRR